MSNLQEFHHAPDAPDIKSRTVVGIIIALVMVAFGVYVYEVVWSPVHPPSPILDTQAPSR
jgi:hypothetical protein